MTSYSDILVDTPVDGVQLIRLNRPEAHNALRTTLLGELSQALRDAEQDDQVHVVVITGSEKGFRSRRGY